jgi:hypothetical protein
MPERRSLNPAPRPERVAVDAELTRDLHLARVATPAESKMFDEQVPRKNGV